MTQEQIDAISDEFQSTFTEVDETTLANMLGMFPDDFTKLETIIKKHVSCARVTYEQIESMPQPGMPNYGMYLIRTLNERQT